MKQKSVCISPLDWGLGHATRCISLIHALEALDYKVYIASEGKHEAILREVAPNSVFLHLKGYRIWYTHLRALLIPGIVLQIPKIIVSVIHEYYWLKRVAKKYKFDLIISDNRFGFFHKSIKSVFITHQLELQTPFGWSTRLNQIITYKIINKYAACWVADMLPPNNLSGINWEEKGDSFKDLVITKMEKTTLPNLRENIVSDFYLTPDYFEQELSTLHGSGFSIQPKFTQSAYFRFHNQSEIFSNMFFVGAGTHPGAGMPGVLSSAKVLDKLL